jgi:transcriptional regulator with XRE-family HTH domain
VTQPLPLEQLRRRQPLTQKELAQAAGVSVGTVRGIEHGYYKSVRPRVIRAIAETLGVRPADVLEFRPSLGLSAELSPERIERIERIEGDGPPDPLPSPSAGYASPGA